jgi:hypothetical protein
MSTLSVDALNAMILEAARPPVLAEFLERTAIAFPIVQQE